MREIKFRQWIGDQFVYWGFMNDGYCGPASGGGRGNYYNPTTTPHQQYTGLKDKNGVEIYEGDIFQTSNDFTGCVEWEDGGFMAKIPDTRSLSRNEPIDLAVMMGIEVIGNIYENPELLESAA